jgi:predicted RNase H-like HicB family nuclease
MDTSASDADSKKAVSAFASGTQIATAKVTDATGTQQLVVKKDKDKNYYAKSSAVEGAYKVANDLGDALDKSVDDFRNKKVFDFGWSDPSKIDIRDGAKQTTYTKSGDKWMAAGKQMDSTTVQAVVDKLRDLQATKFPDKGFTTPALEITVTSNDGKRVEKAALSKTGNDWFAKRENEPAIYQIDAKAGDDLQKAIASVKEAPAKKK